MKAMCLIAAASLAASAYGQTTFFVTEDQSLYRFAGGDSPDEFALSDRVIGLSFRSDGTLLASSNVNPDNGEPEFYDILDPFGTPSLTPTDVQLNFTVSCLTFVGDTVYGMAGNSLYSFDPQNGYDATLIGASGLGDVGGLAYNGQTMYALDNESDALYPIDLGNGAAGAAIGSLGVDSLTSGLEFLDGTLYAAVQNATSDALEVGTISLGDGSFSMLQTVSDGAQQVPTALAVIPGPGALALLGAAGVARRRRR